MSLSSETVLRIEHKLDVIIAYLSGQVAPHSLPRDMPKLIPGMGGMTDGVCPITQTPIHYLIDPRSGDVKRSDGLSSGMVDTKPIAPAVMPESKSVILTGNFGDTGGEIND